MWTFGKKIFMWLSTNLVSLFASETLHLIFRRLPYFLAFEMLW